MFALARRVAETERKEIMRKVYRYTQDKQMQEPYTDIKEHRVREGVGYTYVHGGFRGTDIKFSVCFPEKKAYGGRFFQYIPPAANHEDASQTLYGGDDKILFALTHGAYFVESNLGTLEPFKPIPDPTVTYRSSSAVAEYSRILAREIYGDIPRPYGYLYGGSGGAYKTIECVENCDSWDGAVPYVNGAPVSVPHNLTIRAHAMRVLRHKLSGIIEALKADAQADIFAGLNERERVALEELFSFGFPRGSLVGLEFLKDGSLPLLVGGIKMTDPAYFVDFWEKEGYAGADETSDAHEARLLYETRVKAKYIPGRTEAAAGNNTTGVDTNWQRYKGMSGAAGTPLLELEGMAQNDFYEMGCFVRFVSGKAAGKQVYFSGHSGNTVAIAEHFVCPDMMDVLALVEPGDRVILDNSDYIAASDYHLHALPKEPYAGYSSCYRKDGTPKYVQRDVVANFTGSAPMRGEFSCKMIVEHTYCDESAFPYQGDWYKRLVYRTMGKKRAKELYRLQFMDNALHDDRAEPVGAELYFVTNLPCVYQCLLDVADWAEKGIEPPTESKYALEDGKFTVPARAKKRGGIQNVCRISSRGKRKVYATAGESVPFDVQAEIPAGCGTLTKTEWSFEGEKDFPVKTGTCLHAEHRFPKAGKYTVAVRTYNERNGDPETKFTQIWNIDRMSVIVKERNETGI